jgi:Ca2+-binding RTX toxin-like protein
MAYKTITFEGADISDSNASDGVVVVGGLRFTVTAQGNWTLNFSNGHLNFAEDAAFAGDQFRIEVTNVTGASFQYNDYILNYQASPNSDGYLLFTATGSSTSNPDSDLIQNYFHDGVWVSKYQIDGFPPMPASGVTNKLVITDIPGSSGSNPYSTFWLDQFVVDTDYAPPNIAPTFIGPSTMLPVVQNGSSVDVSALLHVSDMDLSQTLFWSQASSPAHGTLFFSGATAASGGTNIGPGGAITYTPAAGFAGIDTFKVQVSDGTATTTRTVTVNVTPSSPGSPDLAAASDTGLSSTDDVTAASMLAFSGTGPAGDTASTVRVFIDGNGNGVYDAGTDASATATVNNGAWSVSNLSTTSLVSGAYNVYALITSASGGLVSAASSPLAITLDKSAPFLTITSDRSVLKAGETATITFTFSEDPGATFTWGGSSGDIVVSGGTLSALTGSGTTRTAVFMPTAGVNSGTASITVAAGSYIDAAGNNGGAGMTPSLTFDTLAPAAPIILAPANGSTTNDGRPFITGIAEVGTTVTVIVDGTAVGTTSVDGNGKWSFTVPTPLAGGAHTFRAQTTDAAGNTSAHSSTVNATIDNAAPAVAITSGNWTDDPTPVIAGTAETDATIRLTIGGAIYVTTAAQGTWSIDLGVATPALGSLSLDMNGDNLVSVTATDTVGNVSAAVAQTLEININDLPTGVVAISGVAVKGEMLTASHTLADADGLGIISYQWQADGADIAGATGATLILADAQVGKAVTVRASYTDGSGHAESVTSAATALIMFMPDAVTAPNAGGGMDITITDPSQLTDSLGTSGVDQVFYSGSDTVILPDTIEDITLWGNGSAQGNGLANAMRGGSGANVLQGEGGNDWIHSGSGKDSVVGGAGNDRIDGGSDNDRVYGGTGRDVIHGGSGNDWIYGGASNDTLYGGSGRDKFRFDTKPGGRSNQDRIVDFKAADDSIFLDDAVFTKLGKGSAKGVKIKMDMFVIGTQAQDAEDRIIYDRGTGSLYYDRDGTGSAAQVKFATLMNKAHLSYHDFLVI